MQPLQRLKNWFTSVNHNRHKCHAVEQLIAYLYKMRNNMIREVRLATRQKRAINVRLPCNFQHGQLTAHITYTGMLQYIVVTVDCHGDTVLEQDVRLAFQKNALFAYEERQDSPDSLQYTLSCVDSKLMKRHRHVIMTRRSKK